LAGIYIHIPFCKQACNYCNFHFSVSLSKQDAMVAAIAKEIEMYSKTDFINSKKIETIYFGGGTPSILGLDNLIKTLDTIRMYFEVSHSAEITLEANPDDISSTNLANWFRCGFNRLSVGIQSFREEELKWMNRAHNAHESLNCLQLIQESAFTNYTIDFIYGSPLQQEHDIVKQFALIASFNIPHISCYALTVEEGTSLYKNIQAKKQPSVDSDRQEKLFFILLEQLKKLGYEQYEISNFCKPNFKSKHNSSYWAGTPYFGFGPAAHSFNGKNIRRWNIANNSLYISQIEKAILPFEQEELTARQLQNEYVMTMLRTSMGIDLNYFKEKFGLSAYDYITAQAQQHITQTNLVQTQSHLYIPEHAKFLSDGIVADLFDI
jgi:oxygen-independent coproporphyrinogen III oxidase